MRSPLRVVHGVLRDIASLFFDDGSLAIAVLVILAVTELLARLGAFDPAATMVFLVSAVIAALVENVVRTARAQAAVSFETQARADETPVVPPRVVMPFPHR